MSVRHFLPSFAILPWLACAEPAPSITEQDAVALGFIPVTCSPLKGVPLYVLTIPPDDQPTAPAFCAAAATALGSAADAALVPREALSADSIAVIAVWRGLYALLPNRPSSPHSFFDVTFDLAHRDGNIRVVIDEPSTSVPEVSWAPQGLRY